MELNKIKSVLEQSLKTYGLTSQEYSNDLVVAFMTVDLIRSLHDLSSPTETRPVLPIQRPNTKPNTSNRRAPITSASVSPITKPVLAEVSDEQKTE